MVKRNVMKSLLEIDYATIETRVVKRLAEMGHEPYYLGMRKSCSENSRSADPAITNTGDVQIGQAQDGA